MSEFKPAKRGDFVLIETRHSDFVIGGGPSRDYRQFEVHEVTSVTREGAVKAVRTLQYDDAAPYPLARMVGYVNCWMLPRADFETEAVRAAVRAVVWEHKPDWVKGYWSTLDEARRALAPCRKVSGGGSSERG